MSKERAMELLNAIIDNLSVAENNITVIKHLLYIGFTQTELIDDFGFLIGDVADAMESMDYYEDNLILV